MTYSADNPPDVSGKTVVLAGVLEHLGRMEARLGLKKAGAEVVKELDETVDFVAANGGPKLDQALAMGIVQIDEPTLAAVLGISPFPPPPPAPEPEPEHTATPPTVPTEPAPAAEPAPEVDTGPPLPDLSGKQVVIAGTFADLGRMEARLGLQKLGATVVKELDASLAFVVAGPKGGPKLEQALALGIAHLEESTLVALLAGLERKKQTAAVAAAGPKLPKVDGAVIIIAGTLEVMARPLAKRKLEKLGAIVTDKLDGGVSFVVAGAKGGPTLFNAKELGIPQIDEATLAALVEQLGDDDVDESAEEGPPVLAGAVVVVAGVPTGMGRTQTARRLEKLGATVSDQVDRHVKYVFVCQGGASKLFQAKELSIREVDEATLLELIADVPDDEEGAGSGPTPQDIAGKKLLIAGTLQQVGRVEAKNKLTRLGAEVVDRFTDEVAYVVAGAEGGRSLFLAKQANLPIIDEAQLLPLLAQAPQAAEDTAPELPAPEGLAGLQLVIAGKMTTVDRAQAKRKLTRVGARVVTDVDAEVAFLFVGEKGGRNLLLARQLSVPVFDETALAGLLTQIPDLGPQEGAAVDLPDLAGRTVVLTGKLQQLHRKVAMERIQELGATIIPRVDDTPDFVITGAKGGRAVFVAKQESIPVLDEATLIAIFDKGVADGVLKPLTDGSDDDTNRPPLDLTASTLAFTGKFPSLDLAALKQQLGARGVTVHPGITADTRYVVVGEKPSPMKLFRAKKLGVIEITTADVQAFLKG